MIKKEKEVKDFMFRSQKAYSTIALALTKNLQVHVSNTVDPKEAWDILASHFNFVSITQNVRVTRAFYGASMDEGGNLMEHITKMTALSGRLRELGEVVDSKRFAIVVLGSLPESYDNFITSLNARSVEQLTWDEIKPALIEEYMKMKEKGEKRRTEDALIMRRGGGGNSYSRGRGSFSGFHGNRPPNANGNQQTYHPPQRGGGNQGPRGYNPNCWKCKNFGHLARNCPTNEQGNIASESNKRGYETLETDIALITTSGSISSENNDDDKEVSPICKRGRFEEEPDIVVEKNDTVNVQVLVENSTTENLSVIENSATVVTDEGDLDNSVEVFLEPDIALMTSDYSSSTHDEWFIDSAASSHMTFSQDHYEDNYEEYEHPKEIFLGNDASIFAIGEGKVRLPFTDKNKVRYLALEQVLYVPELAKNLLSVPTMTKKGAVVSFDHKHCMISKDNESFVVGGRVGNSKLYKVNVSRNNTFQSTPAVPTELQYNKEFVNTTTNEMSKGNVKAQDENPTHKCKVPSIDLWHKRFGHLNHKYVEQLDKNKLVTGMNCCGDSNCRNKEGNCEACVLGKMHKKSFPKKTENRAKKNLRDNSYGHLWSNAGRIDWGE